MKLFVMFLFISQALTSQVLFKEIISTQSNDFPRDIIYTDSTYKLLLQQSYKDTNNKWISSISVFKITSSGLLTDSVNLFNFNDNVYCGQIVMHKGYYYIAGDYINKLPGGFTLWKYDSAFQLVQQRKFTFTGSTEAITTKIKFDDSTLYILGIVAYNEPWGRTCMIKSNINLDSLGSFISNNNAEAYDFLINKYSNKLYIFTWMNPMGVYNYGNILTLNDSLNYVRVDTIPKEMYGNCTPIWLTDSTFFLTGLVRFWPDTAWPWTVINTDVVVQLLDTNFLLKKMLRFNIDTVNDWPGLFRNLVKNTMNRFIVAGIIDWTNDTNKILVSMIDSSLNIIWEKRFGGDGDYVIHSIIDTEDGGCILVGTIVSLKSDLDAFIIKIGPNGELLSNQKIPLRIQSQIKVYPNPAQEKFTITLKDGGNLPGNLLQIFGIQGNKVKEVVFPKYQKSLQVSISDLQPGLYLGRIVCMNGENVGFKFVKE